ncbi:tetratricopeptide (TPR) repeat protein [Bradyrhizobium japonicum]
MTAQAFPKKRDIVPRWRPAARVAASGELAMPGRPPKESRIPEELKTRLEAWRRANDLIAAAELVETAIVEGREQEAERAARSLLRDESEATPLVKKQAALLLGRLNPDASGQTGIEIGPLRRHVYRYPEDALSWVDLALGYVSHGDKDKAKRAMTVALQLAPADRHVLRSAARMHLHLDDPEQAHDVLKRNAATKFDPWLVAGEIALSSAAGRKPQFFKVGVDMVEDGGFQPLHVSELASAIGTVHLRDGNRRARKLFRTSLINPTGNSLAQAEWANPHLGGELVTTKQIDRVLDSGEARAFHAYWQGDFDGMLKICEQWMMEEPFASKPYAVGSSVAITIGDLDLGLRWAERGLELEPESLLFRNHLAYALIEKGDYARASQLLRQALIKKQADEMPAEYLAATASMLSMRLGEIDEGIAGYKAVIATFKRQGNKNMEASAAAYLALEAARAGIASASEFIKQAEDLAKDLRYAPDCKVVLQRAKRWQAAVEHRLRATRGE